MWPCKDGFISWFYFGGTASRWDRPVIQWLESEGMIDDFLREFDWETFDWRTTSQDVVDHLEEPPRRFFQAHTKAEILEGALQHRAMLYPVATTRDILESKQLAARGFWVGLEHPELADRVVYPGAWFQAAEVTPDLRCRAPLVGEHNREILEELSGLQPETFPARKQGDGGLETGAGRKLLGGVRVVDFTWNIVGPLTTRTLADYGAEVIKIENGSRPDPHRLAAPFKDDIPGLNTGGPFNQDANGKLSIAVNLAYPGGVDIAKKLVARADIVVESFAPGVIERLGLGYEDLRGVRPDIIMLSTCMQGHTGPYATHPGLGYHLVALSGFSQITGWPDREPLYIGPYTDYIVPHVNTVAILAALDYRRRTGRGQYIDVSQYEASLHFIAPLILDYAVNQRVADRTGNRSDRAAPHSAYRCRGDDRWCAIAVFTDEDWRSFGQVIGNPSWVGSPRFSTLEARKDNEDELDRLVESWTIHQSAEEVMTLMQAAGVAAGVLQTGEDLLEKDPQLQHRHFFWELDHPEIGKHYARSPSFRLSKSPYELRRSPLLGEHNEYILGELLGLSSEEIAGLVTEGVIE